MPTLKDLMLIKKRFKHTKMRLQCVLCDVNSVGDVLDLINAYSFADDISFRKLMKLNEQTDIKYDDKQDLYNQILEYAFNHFELVYEIWKYNGTFITFSHSNMKMLSEIEIDENDSVCREFIIHPNGTISGSWDKNIKVIKR